MGGDNATLLRLFIKNYGIKKFIRLSGRAQNKILYEKFPDDSKQLIRKNKSNYLNSIINTDVNSHTHKSPQHSSFSPPPARSSTAPGGVSVENTDPIAFAKQMLLAQAAKHTKAAQYILENKHLFTEKKIKIEYRRPVQKLDKDGNIIQLGLNPKQEKIVDAILDEDTFIILVEGDRRTGKTTSWWYGMLEAMLEGSRTKWGLWAATEATCMKLHRDAVNDPNFVKYHDHLIQKSTGKSTTFVMDDCRVETHATKMSDASGLQYQGIVIDEFHQVLKDNPEAFATIMGITRSEPNMKIILVCNMGTGVYAMFKKKLQTLIEKGVAKFFTLEREDTSHILDQQDEVARTMMEAAMGSAWAKSQLDNIYNAEGDIFLPAAIEWAYTNYKPIMTLDNQVATKKVMAIDPSGTGHPFGWFIGACNSGGRFFWELASGEMQLGASMDDIESGEKWSQERIDAFLISKAKEHHVDLVLIESNMSGPAMRLKFLGNNLMCMHQNFGSKDSDYNRENMIGLARHIMDSECLVLKGEALQDSLLKYDPDKENTQKRKGDSADAMIHCLWKLCELTVSNFMYDNENQIYVR
jgi:hypothetical protein